MTTCNTEDAELSDKSPITLRPKTSAPDVIETEDLFKSEEMDTYPMMETDHTLDALTYVVTLALDPLEIHGWDCQAPFKNQGPVQKALWDMV